MGREAYRSLYGDLTKLKDSSLLEDPAGGSGDDDELFQLLLSQSDWLDMYINRRIYPHLRTLYLDGSGNTKLLVPDLISVTNLKEDTDKDGTFDLTWASTDYILSPRDAEPTQHWGHPYTALEIAPGGDYSIFPAGDRNFELIAKFGFREFKEDSGNLLNDASFTASKTSLGFDGSGGAFAIGQTIMLDDEQMLVTAGTTTPLTVRRGLNGTTAATHADNAPIYILRWPAAIERACLINAARIWTRAPGFEPFFVNSVMDTDVMLLLDPYRSIPV